MYSSNNVLERQRNKLNRIQLYTNHAFQLLACEQGLTMEVDGADY